MTEVETHTPALVYSDDRRSCHYECPCGWRTSASLAPTKRTPPQPKKCPNDKTVTALSTLQFSWGGLFDGRPADGYAVHLVRSTPNGTPGPTLCGIDRFAKDTPGWSVGGGVTGRDIAHNPCPGCVDTAVREFSGLPVVGSVGAKQIRTAIREAEAVSGVLAFLTGGADQPEAVSDVH